MLRSQRRKYHLLKRTEGATAVEFAIRLPGIAIIYLWNHGFWKYLLSVAYGQ